MEAQQQFHVPRDQRWKEWIQNFWLKRLRCRDSRGSEADAAVDDRSIAGTKNDLLDQSSVYFARFIYE